MTLVTDEELDEQFRGTNYGGRSPRDVLDEGMIKTHFGYSTGGRLQTILYCLGLITKGGSYKRPVPTSKGRKYVRSLFNEDVVKLLLELRRNG